MGFSLNIKVSFRVNFELSRMIYTFHDLGTDRSEGYFFVLVLFPVLFGTYGITAMSFAEVFDFLDLAWQLRSDDFFQILKK